VKQLNHYRVSFDYAAETPRDAVTFLFGIVQDPGLRERKFDWLVRNLDTGEESTVVASNQELEQEATRQIQQLMERLQ